MWTFLDEWTRCISSQHQRDSVYRFGKFDSCSSQYQDLKLSFRAKMMKDPQEAKELLATSSYKQNLGSDSANSPTATVIWELKKTPGWEVED